MKEMIIKDSLDQPTSSENLILNDPLGFEDRLMARVKDALKGIIQQQIKDNESNRDAYADLDRQIKQLTDSVAHGSNGVHNASATVVLEVSPNRQVYHQKTLKGSNN